MYERRKWKFARFIEINRIGDLVPLNTTAYGFGIQKPKSQEDAQLQT